MKNQLGGEENECIKGTLGGCSELVDYTVGLEFQTVCFQMVDKMAAILFSFTMVQTIGKPYFWKWYGLAKSLVLQWSRPLENRTKWRPSCF